MTAVAVIGLEIDPSRMAVCAVAGTRFSRSAMPNPAAQRTSDPIPTATLTPGIELRAISVEMICSMRRIFSGVMRTASSASSVGRQRAATVTARPNIS